MLKVLLRSAVIAVTCFSCLRANAQIDTSNYDLGRIRLKTEFTQSVTIKGEDLEKFPAVNLTDAINVWLSGVNTRQYGVIYVVDGNMINDVNAYSVFDIEEATLIENASTALNGAEQQQSLVLIKTRRNRSGKSGLVVAGQTNLSNTRKAGSFAGTSTATYYQQYYLSAYKNTDNTHYGLSADY